MRTLAAETTTDELLPDSLPLEADSSPIYKTRIPREFGSKNL